MSICCSTIGGYWDSILRQDVENLKRAKEHYQNKSQELERLVKEYHNSTSWKCTVPLRGLFKVLREKGKEENK